jgi:hypothetical protein
VWRFRCLLIAAPFLCSSAGCLLYTDKFNVPPEVELRGPVKVVKGKQQEFTAVIHDPNDDPARANIAWFLRQVLDTATCPTTLPAAQEQPVMSVGSGPTFLLKPDRYGSFCLWVIVTDSAGSSGFAEQAFKIENTNPNAIVDLLAPTPLRWVGNSAYVSLYSRARLSARKSFDPEEDSLNYLWTIRRNNEPIPATPCAGATDITEICHTLDQPGDYRFELVVSDGEYPSEPYVLPISVMPDAPPCIQQTEPPYSLPRVVAFSGERTNINVVAVSDDGDPFPSPAGQLSQTAFVWRYRYAGAAEFYRLVSTTMPGLSFAPETFRPGEEIEVRVDVFDRVPERDFRSCEGKPECELEAGSGCKQRVSWRVSFL